MINSHKKEQIAFEVIRTLYKRFIKFPSEAAKNRNAPFHEAFLKAFQIELENAFLRNYKHNEQLIEHGLSREIVYIPTFISLSSWLHGLNTSLGQSFFQNVAQILCDGEKEKKFSGNQILQSQKNTVYSVITDLKNAQRNPNTFIEEREIFDLGQNDNLVNATDFVVDIFYEDEKDVVALELKTVRPNSGVFKVEKQKILEAKTALKGLYPEKYIYYYLGFPFDPLHHTPTGFDKERFMDLSIDFRKYFHVDEFLIADELWDFLSGEQNTMQTILDIINVIATPNFMEKLNFINNQSVNLQEFRDQYMRLLDEWCLISEKQLVEHLNEITLAVNNNRRLKRYFNQPPFLLYNTSSVVEANYNSKKQSKLLDAL